MFNPKFAWVDPTMIKGKKIQEKAFELRYADMGNFDYSNEGFVFIDNGNKVSIL